MAAESVAGLLEKKKHHVSVQRAEQTDPKELMKADFCILASPTYGHGHLQEYMAAFVVKMKGIDLKGKPCAVIGLGDPKYNPEFHLEAAVLLEKAVEGANGKLVPPTLRMSSSPVKFLDTMIKKWAENLSKSIK